MTHYVLSHSDTGERLAQAGIDAVRSAEAATLEEVRARAATLRQPVVLKAGGLVHKSDLGGVRLGLASADAVEAAAATMLAEIGPIALPFVLQEQVAGVEILVGARRHPRLGVAVVVGLGGTMTEIHQDMALAMAPITRSRALAMLQELRGWPLLSGFRGQQPCDVKALVNIVVALSELVAVDSAVVEVDLNPVMVRMQGEGAVVADARIVHSDPAPAVARPKVNLDRMLRPRHVAVVGASDDPHKAGGRLYKYLINHGFSGRLDPVHPSGGQIAGRVRARTLADVEGSPDLVCIAVPSRYVLNVAREAAAKRVGGVIVHSSDFAEAGEQGRAMQEELVGILAGAGIPLAGPNDMGIVAPHGRLAASISGGLEEPLTGGQVALLTSSGALGSCLATRLMGGGVGFSYWVHAGNEADLTIADYLDWLADDDQTLSAGLLLEDIKDGPRFIEAGHKMARAGKPVFAYSMVRTAGGQEAALSHTGAMAGSFEVRDAVLRAASIASVPSLRALEDVMILSATTSLPKGPRLVGVTFSGGVCSIIADAAAASAIDLPALSAATASAIREHVPSYSAVRNPIDLSFQMLTRADSFERVIDMLGHNDEYDAILLQFTTNADPYAERLAEKVVALRERIPVPVYVARYGAEYLAPRALTVYRNAHVPLLDAPDRACEAIAALMRARHLQDETR